MAEDSDKEGPSTSTVSKPGKKMRKKVTIEYELETEDSLPQRLKFKK
jgi:hypothetical protein